MFESNPFVCIFVFVFGLLLGTWLERLTNGIKGVLVGAYLVALACPWFPSLVGWVMMPASFLFGVLVGFMSFGPLPPRKTT